MRFRRPVLHVQVGNCREKTFGRQAGQLRACKAQPCGQLRGCTSTYVKLTPCDFHQSENDTKPDRSRRRPAGRPLRLRRPDLIAKAPKSMHTFDLACRRSGSILFDQLATAGGSRAAAEGEERGLDTGTSDPRRRPEGDQGRCAGGLRRAAARLSPSVTVDLVCLVGAGYPRCSRPARPRRTWLVPSLTA